MITDIAEQIGAISRPERVLASEKSWQQLPGATMRRAVCQPSPHRAAAPTRRKCGGLLRPCQSDRTAPWLAVTAPHAGRGTGCPAAGNWPEELRNRPRCRRWPSSPAGAHQRGTSPGGHSILPYGSRRVGAAWGSRSRAAPSGHRPHRPLGLCGRPNNRRAARSDQLAGTVSHPGRRSPAPA